MDGVVWHGEVRLFATQGARRKETLQATPSSFASMCHCPLFQLDGRKLHERFGLLAQVTLLCLCAFWFLVMEGASGALGFMQQVLRLPFHKAVSGEMKLRHPPLAEASVAVMELHLLSLDFVGAFAAGSALDGL